MKHIEIRLSERQRQVAALKKSGASNKEIAELLGISEMTVRSHVRHVYDIYAGHGIDLHKGTLIEQKARMRMLQLVAKRAAAEANFGLQCS